MSKQTDGRGGSKIVHFFKKNIYYILMVVAVLAIIAMIVTAAVMSSNANDDIVDGPVINTPDTSEPVDKPDKPVTPKPDKPAKVFAIAKPIATETLGLGYSEDELVFHPTQGAWKTHLGIDYMAKAGTEVMAVFDGKVKSVETDGYYGTTMVIEHQDGFESVYKLLDKEVVKKVGDTVNSGEVIGKVGNASTYEVKEGEHMHFELMKAGKLVDPNLYFVEGDK